MRLGLDRALRPPPLRLGDTVRVIAPSSPFEPALAWRGLGFLAQRYHVEYDRGIFSRQGYLAGGDERRAEELRRALVDPGVRAIIAARGGYGLSRFIHRVDMAPLVKDPRWIVGFSDITALHVEASRVGVCSMHACNLTALGRADTSARQGLIRALERPYESRSFAGLTTLAQGRAVGPLTGGNLALLHACAAAGRLRLPEGGVLFIEDVTERPYRVDRMLATLIAGGHLARVSAVVLGEFYACAPLADGVTVLDVARQHLAPLGVPVVAGLPAGHGRVNEPLILGAPARVEADADGAKVCLSDVDY